MSEYTPIPTEELPVQYAHIFEDLELTFTPANGNSVVTTITGKPLELICETQGRGNSQTRVPVWHPGYQKAIWDLKNGHLRYCPSNDRLWRRDPDTEDHDGPRRILNSWHPIKTIEDEYAIGTDSRSNSRKPAVSNTITREAKRAQWFPQVERGLRIGDSAWVRRDNKITRVNDPELAVTQSISPAGITPEAVSKAQEYCHWLTNDDGSFLNLVRMFATPWLEPFKQLSYVLSGHGGDGKTLIMQQIVLATLTDKRVFPGLTIGQYCSGGGYTFAKEGMNDAMDGKAFAYDDEAPTITESMLAPLRALSTGSQMQARVTGGKYRTIKPSATIVILTNNPFADSSEPSDRRRFVKIEMHPSEERTYSQYHEIELFAREHASAFYWLSANLWQQGDKPEIVNLQSARSISDEMYWIISEINENTEKYDAPIASCKKFREEFHHSIPDSARNLLGLANSTTITFDHKQSRVVRVVDRHRFDTYAKTITDETESEPAMTVETPNPPAPIEADQLPLPGEFAFRCAYTPADANKVARNWKKLSQDPSYDSTQRPDTDAYAVVPGLGMAVIDMDKAKDAETADGWTTLNTQIGQYGSDTFPATYLVGTPSGGAHAYYALPLELMGKLKNSVHSHGIPVDVRCENKGYVIGPGSHTDKGEYQLLDMPADGSVPVMTPALVRWLEDNGYVDGIQPTASSRPKPMTAASPSSLPSIDDIMREDTPTISSGNPDMTPIPEGQRNTTLFNWAFGRLLNHPENETSIRSDTYQRGHMSGLADAELTTLWNSVLTTVQQHR